MTSTSSDSSATRSIGCCDEEGRPRAVRRDVVVVLRDARRHQVDESAHHGAHRRRRLRHPRRGEGNHDLYLVSETQSRMYHHNSFERLNEMKELANKIEGVHFLEGNIVEIEGKKFCGTGLWYDFQYGVKNYGLTIQDLSKYWQQYMTDSRLIEVISLDSETESGMIDNISYFKSELEKLKKVYQQSDVILTHVGPDWSMIKEHHKNAGTSFFYFDGEELLQNCYGKTWLYGHTHDPVSYDKYGCKLICNPLGYPHENIVGNNMDNLNYKFKTVDI